ncbi:hypothetical protein [Runella limosa]|uniref:hypothetical protein n=1 Tax=Runella limosa TaxID=370978 RepID=UPI0003FEDFE2|nr:hypothetical protein [Runella limosa]
MVYFSDYFNIDPEVLETYGAFDISLINDLPLFIDPFLLYGSDKPEYKILHDGILRYLSFLQSKSQRGSITDIEIESWYKFSEVKQNWLGFSLLGNSGSGLGKKFGRAMSSYMHVIFDDIYKEPISQTSHLEKAALFQIGVGKDNISDFTCNLIKSFLLEYTESFAKQFLQANQVKLCTVEKAYFNYEIEKWMAKTYLLPVFDRDYVILTPKDLLTKDENWINSNDLQGDFTGICNSIPNSQLREEIFNFYRTKLPPPVYVGKGRRRREKPIPQKDLATAINETILKFPEIIDYYIKIKEENSENAISISDQKVQEVETIFSENVKILIKILSKETTFYEYKQKNSYDEALDRIKFLKDVIENKDGYKLFYYKGNPIKREADLQVIYRLTWYSSPYDVNREVNNGRGPVDYAISYGANNKVLVEFKLASNSKLKMNLQNQTKIYESASNTKKSIKVILYFDETEYIKIKNVLKELELENEKSIVLIDAGGNKLSASNVR